MNLNMQVTWHQVQAAGKCQSSSSIPDKSYNSNEVPDRMSCERECVTQVGARGYCIGFSWHEGRDDPEFKCVMHMASSSSDRLREPSDNVDVSTNWQCWNMTERGGLNYNTQQSHSPPQTTMSTTTMSTAIVYPRFYPRADMSAGYKAVRYMVKPKEGRSCFAPYQWIRIQSGHESEGSFSLPTATAASARPAPRRLRDFLMKKNLTPPDGFNKAWDLKEKAWNIKEGNDKANLTMKAKVNTTWHSTLGMNYGFHRAVHVGTTGYITLSKADWDMISKSIGRLESDQEPRPPHVGVIDRLCVELGKGGFCGRHVFSLDVQNESKVKMALAVIFTATISIGFCLGLTWRCFLACAKTPRGVKLTIEKKADERYRALFSCGSTKIHFSEPESEGKWSVKGTIDDKPYEGEFRTHNEAEVHVTRIINKYEDDNKPNSNHLPRLLSSFTSCGSKGQ